MKVKVEGGLIIGLSAGSRKTQRICGAFGAQGQTAAFCRWYDLHAARFPEGEHLTELQTIQIRALRPWHKAHHSITEKP
ncbi:hypothetical protein [Skermanella pratensis]|uniref:hypothetical protein n=1 Tax=Skermanella pratensis TaxID=2233999 RepID=UPI0013019388|nr:hypothetical protein [Skermanella pratensis]